MSGTLAPDRLRARAALLHRAGWAAADRRFLAGDASDRSYERLRLGGRSAVLMEAPPGKGDDPAAFLAIAGHLRGIGLSAPHVLAQDLAHGFLLLEDLGDGLFTRLIASDPALELPLTLAAADVLLHLQAHPAPAGLPDLTAAEWSAAAALALDWYGRAATGTQDSRQSLPA
jgi:N-acetylmuramate 1-kinase